jgi:hypothetical protein
VRTYELIETLVEEVVLEVVHCTPRLDQLPTPLKGRVDIPTKLYTLPTSKAIDLDKTIKDLGGITDVIKCFVEGNRHSLGSPAINNTC